MTIKRRLPLTYAAIALLSVLALGAVLIFTLQEYYQQQEKEYLQVYAGAISAGISPFLSEGTSTAELKDRLDEIALLSQIRIRLLDLDGNLIADSGPPPSETEYIFASGRLPLDVSFDRRGAEPRERQELFESTRSTPQLEETNPVQESTSVLEQTPEPGQRLRSPLLAEIEAFSRLNQPILRSDQILTVSVTDLDGNRLAALELSQGPALSRSITNSVIVAWAVAGTLAVLLAGLSGWFVSRRFTQPLSSLDMVTTQMASGDLTARANISHKDEFGRLAVSFNRMAERVERQIAALRRFVADAAHGIHTPLTALRTNLELASNNPNNEGKDYLSQAREQLSRLESLSNNLLALSRLEAEDEHRQDQAVDLTAILTNLGESYASMAEQAGVKFSLSFAESPLIVNGVRDDLSIMASNLIENAIKFTPEGGEVKIYLEKDQGQAVLTVEDTGIGIPPDDLEFLFTRFRRGRNASPFPGSGLGLAIVKTVVESHHGTVIAIDQTNGSRFIVRLPLN